jgi:hypothetical protein
MQSAAMASSVQDTATTREKKRDRQTDRERDRDSHVEEGRIPPPWDINMQTCPPDWEVSQI